MTATTLNQLRYQLLCLEDPVVCPKHKLRATSALIAGGKTSIGLLIERMGKSGDCLFMDQLLVPTGPMNPGSPRKMRVSLKFQIEYILYEILYPEQAPRPELKGEPVTHDLKHNASAADAPQKSLAEMKAEWDNTCR